MQKKTPFLSLDAEKRGNLKNIKMKVRRISEFQARIDFPNFDSNYKKHLNAFKTSSLGQIHSAIPWDNLIREFTIKVYKKGPESIFSPRGKLALMFLKNYAGVSDYKLIEQLNGNIHYQIFCDLLLEPGTHIDNFKVVSQIRCELAGSLKIDSCEKVLFDFWKPHMNNLDSITCDATCYESSIKYPTDVRRSTIKKILTQQDEKFNKGIRPKGAIVSIDKPHIRPIVRGKEIKSVEFGSKLHKLQIDGISFIEHISFDAFHEGNRLKKTIWKAQKLTNKKVNILGADAIYATNVNRTYVSNRMIKTDFKPKGRPGRHKAHKTQLAKMITKERASRLEGSFGTDKAYFLLNKIKARTKETEILWIFIGIHTSNALNIGRRMSKITSIAA